MWQAVWDGSKSVVSCGGVVAMGMWVGVGEIWLRHFQRLNRGRVIVDVEVPVDR